jgi:hypothetical protein
MRFPAVATTLTLALVSWGCATLKAPSMQLEKLRVDKVNVTGMKLEVRFQVRNPSRSASRTSSTR